jgi:DNA repair exonuclease SbcCD ATPase subunit
MIAAMVATMTACNNSTEGQWLSEKDSIMNVNEQQRQVLDELTTSLVEVSACLDSIAVSEGLLQSSEEGPVLTKKQMLENLATFKATLAENKAKLNDLEKKISSKDSQLAKLGKVVKYLNGELAAKEARIAELEKELTSANANISTLRNQMSSMSSTIGALQEENDAQREALVTQSASLNTGYYAIGTSKDLKAAGLISGGGLKKKKVNYENFDQSLFVKVNTRNTTQMLIPSKKVKILTSVPSDSYALTRDGNSTVLQILDVDRFWSVSKYLVIQID